MVHGTLIDPTSHSLTGASIQANQLHHAFDLIVLAEHFELDLLGHPFAQFHGVHLLFLTECLQHALDVAHRQVTKTCVLQRMNDVDDTAAMDECLDFFHGVSSCDFALRRAARSSIQSYNTGNNTNVSNAEVFSPPPPPVAGGRWVSRPPPRAGSSGTGPRMATLAVIITGRMRNAVPRIPASRTARPFSRCSLRKLTDTMPFNIATPNTAMKPMAEGTERYCPVIAKPTMPPMMANGTLARINTAYFTELNAV